MREESRHRADEERREPPPVVFVNVTGCHSPEWMLKLVFRLLVWMLVAAVAIYLSGWIRAPILGEIAVIAARVMMILFAGTVIPWSVLRLVARGWRREAQRVLANPRERDCEEIVNALVTDMSGIVPPRMFGSACPKDAAAFQRRLADLGCPSVLTIVDERLRTAIGSIEPIRDFVEAEAAMSRFRPWSGWMVYMVAVTILLGAMLLVPGILRGDGVQTMMGGGVIVMMMIHVARSFGFRIGESLAPVVSMGVLTDRKGRRWTVADSCLYVRGISMVTTMSIVVEVVGPSGHRVIYYPWGPKDMGFQLLWQRWMHPHPRPELG